MEAQGRLAFVAAFFQSPRARFLNKGPGDLGFGALFQLDELEHTPG